MHSDNRLHWSIAETMSKSYSIEAKSMQLKGRSYKENLVRWWIISFITELLRWMLTVKSKRFQGMYSTCTLIWNSFYSWFFTVNVNFTFLITWPFNVHRKWWSETLLIRVFCVCVCLSVCLWFLRSRERDVVAPHCFHQCEELLLVSCNDWFLSRHDAWFRRKSL